MGLQWWIIEIIFTDGTSVNCESFGEFVEALLAARTLAAAENTTSEWIGYKIEKK